MHGGVGPQALGHLIPLAARAHPEDDPVKHEAQVGAGAPCPRHRIAPLEDWLDPLPEPRRGAPQIVGRGRSGVMSGDRQGTLLFRGLCLAVSVQGRHNSCPRPEGFRIVT